MSKWSIDNTENLLPIIRHFAHCGLIRLLYVEGGRAYASYYAAAKRKNAPAHAAFGGGAGGGVPGRAGRAAVHPDAA